MIKHYLHALGNQGDNKVMIIELALILSSLLTITRAIIDPLNENGKVKGHGGINDQLKSSLVGLIEKNVNTNHRLEKLDRQLSTTAISLISTSNAVATTDQGTELNTIPTFYTRSDGYLIRYMNKAMPTTSAVHKAKQAPNGNNAKNDSAPRPSPEEKPARPTQPVEPARPTVTMGRPANTNNNNNGQPPAVPTRTSAGNGGRSGKTSSPRATKRSSDEDDDGEDDDNDQPRKISPGKKTPSATQPAHIPAKTSDAWGGDNLLPTRSSKPRWMRNGATSGSWSNLALSASLSFVLLLATIF